ncbi:hypothetical protein RHGRI_020484 [Rhododendron griersonianum]|uniref:Uncharacterized protein n=1 Tax=Rhododendron griersonianum TaxID=479676 RepID=A0AAV6IPZ6_9ERIC|nr:hypothetical protein RHGRI_025629 [Rhododendron griersonianum]KAG5536170.1 hypothetical protein RHGRI_023832 [Rhododendron griersonianum]KAG5540265.1 hypothetical protein RHGRI_020484 [Rhododendron griersonianum]
METTYHYRGMLDDLRPSQVIFDPYTGCRRVVADVVFYTGCIRAMAVLEPYLPDRVLRQFGMVPSLSRTYPKFITIFGL